MCPTILTRWAEEAMARAPRPAVFDTFVTLWRNHLGNQVFSLWKNLYDGGEMLERLREIWGGPGDGLLAGAEPAQAGAIAYAVRDGEVRFHLVTSRGSGRWIFPKGWREDGESGADCALREAWEEAGVTGHVTGPAIGVYRAAKAGADRPVAVALYPLCVAERRPDWPERGERRRRWMTLDETRRLVDQPALGALAVRAEARIRARLIAARSPARAPALLNLQ